MGFNQYNLGNHLPCLMGQTFPHLSLVVLKKMFQYFPMYFSGSNPGLSGVDPLWTLGPLFEQTRCRTNFQAAEPSSSVKEKNFRYILLMNPGPHPPGIGPF